MGEKRQKNLMKMDACVAGLNYLKHQYDKGEITDDEYNNKFDSLKKQYDASNEMNLRNKRRGK